MNMPIGGIAGGALALTPLGGTATGAFAPPLRIAFAGGALLASAVLVCEAALVGARAVVHAVNVAAIVSDMIDNMQTDFTDFDFTIFKEADITVTFSESGEARGAVALFFFQLIMPNRLTHGRAPTHTIAKKLRVVLRVIER
jgi:hypothetical protein